MAHFTSVVVIMTALLGAAVAGPVSSRGRTQCASYCRTTDKFQYEPGKTYTYDYETQVVSKIHESAQEHAKLHMTAKAEFSVLAPCEVVLKLRNVHLEEADHLGSYPVADLSDFAYSLEKYPTRFAFQDGLVESLCPVEGEETWALNIKRGVLSLFQNSMNDFEGNHIVSETDVGGICETRYEISNGIYSTTVTKTKDLMTCAERHARFGGLESVSYGAGGSSINNLPILKSSHECSQRIRSNRLEKSECKEDHVLAPFRAELEGSATATTTAIHSLTFSSEDATNDAGFDVIGGQTSLLYQQDTTGRQDGEVKDVLRLVAELEITTESGVVPETPRVFSSLIAYLKTMDFESLKDAYNRIRASPRERKIFVDALALVGTGPSVGLMQDLINAGRIDPEEANSWLTSLAFTSYPTDEMISAVAPLLERTPSRQAMLGISAMVHRYCQRVPNCAESRGVQAVVSHLENHLGTACRVSSDESHTFILAALKAIGNIGLPMQNPDTMIDCFISEENPTEIRVAALQAFRRLPCEAAFIAPLSKLFADYKQDSELRINAYISLMRCPSPGLMDEIQGVLSSEPVNQVGSFVWTHLTNLQETKDPSKQYFRDLLSSDFLRNKFNTDARKFSRNFEGAYMLDDWNLGVQAESNIIFSTKSFIPRSANLNLTTHLFGETVNLLEIGGRVEGLEEIAETLFGKDGYWPREEVSTVFENMREKREIHPDDLGKYLYHTPQELHGHAYARVFGNDLLLTTFRNKEELAEQVNAFSPQSILRTLAKGDDIDVTKNIHFLDTELTIPLGSGFPLHLTINGTASLRLVAKGSMDFTQWITNGGKATAVGQLQPSAAVQIHGLMSIGAGSAKRTGMSLSGTIHTSTMLGGTFEIDGWKLISAKFDAPWEKMEVLEMGTKVSLMRGGHSQQTTDEIETGSYEVREVCTGESMSRIAGIKACSFVSYPKNVNGPTMLLSGDTKLKITVEKTDNFQSYNFDYAYDVEQMGSGPVYTGHVKFDTPGSRVDRLLSTHAILDVPSRMFKWNLQTPVVSSGLEGRYVWDDRMKSANFSMEVNKQEIFSVMGQIRQSQVEEDTVLEPYFLLQFKNDAKFGPVRLGGKIETSAKKFNGKLNLEGLTSKPITIKGTGAMKKNNRVKIEGSVDGPNMNINFHSTFKSDESVDSIMLGAKYSLGNRPHETFDFKGKISREKMGSLYTQNVFAAIQSSASEKLNAEIQWGLQTSHGHFENSVTANVMGYELKLGQYWSAQMKKGLDFETRLAAECAKLNVDLGGNLKAKFMDDLLELDGTLKLSSQWEAKTKAVFTHIAQPFKISVQGTMVYPGTDFKVEADLFSGTPGTYSMEFSSSWSPDGTLSAIGTYNDASTELTLDHRLNLVLRVNQNEPISLSAKVKAEGRHSSATGELQFGGISHAVGVNVATNGGFSHDVSIRATGPEYNYGAEGKFNLNPHDFGALVDLDLGDKYQVDVKFGNQNGQKSADVTITWGPGKQVHVLGMMSPTEYRASVAYPGRTLEGAVIIGEESTQISASWSPEKKITVVATYRIPSSEAGRIGLDIKTPFPSYEHCMVQADYSLYSDDLKATVVVEHTGETLASLKLDGKQMTTGDKRTYSGDISLGGRMAQSLEIDTDGNFKVLLCPSEVEVVLSGVWRNEHVSFRIFGINEANKVEGTIQITSPIPYLKNLQADLQYERQVNGASALVKVNVDQAVWMLSTGGVFDMSSQQNEIAGKLVVITPIQGHEELRLSAQGKMDNARLEGKGEFHVPDLTYSVDMHGNVEFTGTTKRVNGKGLFSGTSLPDIHINVDHTYNIQKKEFQTKVETGGFLFHPVTVQASGRKTRNDIQGKLQASILGTSAEAKFRAKRDGNNYHAGFMAQYEDTKIEAEVNTEFKSMNDFQLKAMVSTPWKYLPQTYLEATHSESSGIQTDIKIEQSDKSYSFQQDFKKKPTGWRSFYQITTPWEGLQMFSAVHDHQVTNNGWDHNVEVIRNKDKSTGKAAFKKTSSGMMEFQGLLSGMATPTIEIVGKLDIPKLNLQASGRFAHKDIAYSFMANGDINMPHGTLAVKLQRSGEPNIVDINMNYYLAMPESQGALTFTAMGQTYLQSRMSAELNPMHSQADLMVTIPNHEIKVTAGHDLTGEQSVGKLTGSYNGKAITVKAEGHFEFFKAGLKVDIETPCEYWRLISTTLNYNFEDAAKSLAFSLGRNGEKKFDMSTIFDLSGDVPGGKAIMTIAGKWNEPYMVKIESTCRTGDHNKEYSAAVMFNANSAKMSIEYNKQDGAGMVAVEVQTEIPSYETLGFEAGINGIRTLKNMKVWANGSFQGEKLELNAETGPSYLTGNALLRLTGTNNIEITEDHDLEESTKTIRVKGNIGGELYEIDGRATTTELEVDIKTPHSDIKHFKILGQYDFSGVEKTAKILLHHNGNRSEMEGILSANGLIQSNAKLSLKTPFEGFTQINGGFDYDLSQDEKMGRIFIDQNGQKSEILASGQLAGKSVIKSNGQFSLKTPFDGFQQMNGGFDYDLENEEKKGSIFFDQNGQKSEVEASGRLNLGDGELNIRSMTPIRNFEDVSISGSFSGSQRNRRAAINMRANKNALSGSMNFADGKLSIDAESPFKGYERMSLNAGLDADRKFSFQAENGDKKMVASFSGHMDKTNGAAHLTLITPLFGGINTEILGNYEITGELIKGQVSVKVNQYEAELRGRISPTMRGSVTISMDTNFQGLKNNELSASWDFTSPKKSIQGSIVTPKGTNTIALNGEITHGNLKAEISLPAAGWEDLKFDGRYKTENGHELTGSLHHNGNLWEVNAGTNCPDKSSCKIAVSLKTPKQVFGRIGGSMEYALQNSTLNGDIKLFYNEQNVGLNLEGKFGKQIGSLTGRLETSFTGHEYLSGKVNYEFPGKGEDNFVTFRYNHNNIDKEFEGRVLIDNGTFRIKGLTPFQGFNKFEARVNIKKGDTLEAPSSLEAFFEKESLQAAIHANIQMGANKGMISLNADIPLRFIGEGKFLTEYDLTNGITGSIELASGIYSGKGSMDISKDKTTGNIKMVGLSPMNKAIPELNAALAYNIANNEKAVKFTWVSDGQLQDYGANLDMDVSVTKGHFNIKIEAPGSGWWQYANAAARYSKDTAKGGWNVDAHGFNEGFTMEANLSLDGHLNLQMPIDGYERITSEWNIQTGTKKSASFKFQLGQQWNVDMTIGITIREKASFVLETSLRTSSLQHPVEVHIDWDSSNTRRGSFAINTKWEASPGNFAANWRLDAESGFLNGNYQLPAIYKGSNVEDGSVRFSYNFQKDTTIDLKTSISRKLQLELSAKTGDGEATVHFETQSPIMGNLRADMNYDLKNKKKVVEGTLVFHGIKHSFASSLEAENSFKVDGQVSINMGGSATYEMKVVYDLQRDSPQKIGHILLDMGDYGHFSTKALLENRDKKAHGQLEMKSSHPALNDITIEGNYDFQNFPSGKFLAQWSASEKLGISFALQNKNWKNVQAFLNVEAPFSELEIFNLNGAWNLEDAEKHGKIDYRLNDESYGITFNLMDVNRAFTFGLNSNVPFLGEKSLVDVSINVNKNDQSIAAAMSHNEHNMKFTGSITYTGPMKAAGHLQMSSNIGSTLEVSINGRYDFTKPKKNAFKFEGTYNGDSLSVAGSINRGKESKASFEIQTPFTALKSATIEGNLNLPEKEGKFTATYQKHAEPIKRLQISYKGSQEGNLHELQVHTPIAGYEDLSATMEMSSTEIGIGMKYGLGKEIRIQGQYEMGTAFSVNGTLLTPFQQYERMAFTSYFMPSAQRDAAYGSASLTWGDNQEASMNAHWQYPVNIQLNIKSPWKPIESLSAKFRIGMQSTETSDEKATIFDSQADWNDDSWGVSSGLFTQGNGSKYRMQGRVNWGTKTIAVESTILRRNQEYDVKFNLVTPFENFEEFTFQTNFSMDSQNWASSFLNGNLSIKTPIPGMKTINARIMGRNNNNYIEAEFAGSLEGQEVAGNIAIGEKENGSYKIKIESVIPVAGKPSRTTLYGSFKLNEDWTQGVFDLRGSLNEKSGEHSAKATYKVNDGGSEISFGLDSSFLNGNSIIFTLGHQNEQEGRMDAAIKAQIGDRTYNADLTWAITSNSIFIKASDNAISRVMLGKPTELELQAAMYTRGSADASVKLTLDGKTHNVAGKYQFDNQNLHAEGKLDSPKLDSVKAFRFDASYNGSEGLDVQAVVSGQKSYSAGFTYSSKQGSLAVKSNGYVDIPQSGRAQFDFALDMKSIELQIKAPGSSTHQIKGSFDMPEAGNRAEVTVDITSPLVPRGELHFGASIRKTMKSLGMNLECTLDGINNSASGEFEYFDEQINGFINLQIPRYNIDGQILKISGSKSDSFEGEVEVRIFGRHRAHASIQGLEKGDVSIFSTAMEAESIRVSYKLNDMTQPGYLTKGEGSISIMIGDEEYAVAFTSNAPSVNDMEGSIFLRTPSEALKSAELSGKIRTTDGFMLDIDFKSSSDIFPTAGLTAKMQFENDVVDASFKLITPVQEFENIGLLINVPRQASKANKRFEPRVSFTMPNSHYTFKGSFKNAEDKANAEVELTWPGNTSKVSIYLKKISPYSVRAEIITPFTGYESISFNGDLNLNFPQDGHAYAALKINEQHTYEGTVALKIQPGMYKIVVDVNTPSEKHNYGVTLRFEKTSRKTIHVEFEYPGSTIGLEFDYVFSGYDNLVAKTSVKTPYEGFEEVTFSLVHQILETGYTGEVGGTLGTNTIMLGVHGEMKEGESAEGNLKLSALGYNFEVTGYGKTLGNHVSAQLEAQSSWEQLKSFRIVYSHADESDSNGEARYSATAEYNGVTHFGFIKASDSKTNEVQIVTPWRTVFGKTVMDWGVDKSTLQGEVCWDMQKRKESTVAATMNVQSTSFGKEAYVEIATPTRTIAIQGDYALTSLKIQHALQYSWKTGSSIGYKILLKNDSDYTQTSYNVDISLELPKFPVTITGVFKKVGDDVTSNGQIKYRDQITKVSAEYRNTGSWSSQSKVLNIFLAQPLSEAPISLQSEFGHVDGVTVIKAKFAYSNDRSNDFKFEWNDDKSYKVTGLNSDNIRPRAINLLLTHPSSDLDIQFQTKYGSSETEMAGEIKASYLDRFKNTRMFQWEGHFFPTEYKVITHMELDSERLGVEGKVGFQNGFQSMVQTQRGMRTPLIHSLNIDSSRPLAEIKMDYGPSRTLGFSMGMPSEREASLSLTRSTYNNDMSDALFLAKLNTSHIFHSKLIWRPKFWNEALDEVQYRLGFMKQELGMAFGDVGSFWVGELEHHFEGIPESIQRQVTRLSESMSDEIRYIAEYYEHIKGQIQEMVDANSFFLKDITAVMEFFGGHISNLVGYSAESIQEILGDFGNFASDIVIKMKDGSIFVIKATGKGIEAVNEAARKAYTHGEKIVTYAVENWETLSDQVEEWTARKFRSFDAALQKQIDMLLGSYKQTLNDLYALSTGFYQWLQDYAVTVQAFAKDYQTAAANHPSLAKAVQFYKNYASWLEEWHVSDYAIQFKDQVVNILEQMIQEAEKWTKDYNEYLLIAKDAAQGQYSELKKVPLVGYLSELATRLHQTFQWAWRYYELEEMVQQNLKTIITVAQKQVNEALVELTTGHPAPWDFKNNYIWEPEKGRIEITQRHPFVWDSFKEWPRMDEEIIEKLNRAFSKFDMNNQWHKFLDTVTTSKEKMLNVASVIPPFNAYAIIAGNQHFITFDKKSYEFAGDCSYTLLSDPKDKFSIAVNFKPGETGVPQRESLTVRQNDKNIQISRDYKVTLNSQNIDLPWKSGGMTIWRESGSIFLDNGEGIELMCLIKWDACTVKMSGWHFGRTYGLLGTFNNEPHDDFTGSDGEVYTDVNRFADTWKLDKSCMVKNYATSVPGIQISSNAKTTCNTLFSSHDSALSPCFQKLDPALFIPMCYNDMEVMKNQPHAQEGACISAAAYVSACRAEGMDIWMPPQCVKCELEDKSVIMAAETVHFNGNAPKSTDVIIAVDHSGCVTSERVAGIVHNLDAELVAAGSSDNRFTMVGFNGQAPLDKPTVQTSEGSIWVRAQSFKRAVEIRGIGEVGLDVASIHDAVQYAARLPFRAGVGKTMILISCNECKMDSTQTYSDSLNMLLERNIAFHYITHEPITLKGSKQNVSPWPIGYDSKMAYTLKDSRKMVGDAGLKDLIKIPKDLCVPLALESNGTVFSLEVFSTAGTTQATANNPTRAKKYYAVIAKKVVETAQPPACQRCDCVADHSGLGSAQCQPCLPHHLDMFMKEYNRLHYDFNQSPSEAIPYSH